MKDNGSPTERRGDALLSAIGEIDADKLTAVGTLRARRVKRRRERVLTLFVSLGLCVAVVAAVIAAMLAAALPVAATGITEVSKEYVAQDVPSDPPDGLFPAKLIDFSLDMFREIVDDRKKTENTVFSPFSAALGLALLAHGTDGQTRAQIEEACGMDIEDFTRNMSVLSRTLTETSNGKVRLANSVWVRNTEDITVKPSFLQRNADLFGADVFTAPFDEETRLHINRWAAEKTDGALEELLTEPINDATRLYLINTLFADLEWREQFIKDREAVFHNADGSESNAVFLGSIEMYVSGDDFTGFVKHCRENYLFVALLPNEGLTATKLAKKLSATDWAHILQSSGKATVWLPEFSLEIDLSLKDVCRDLGIVDLFSRIRADLSPMATCASPLANLYCSAMDQKVDLIVDGYGIRAAASTLESIVIYNGPPPLLLEFDRPFVYALLDAETCVPLFLGVQNEIK